MLFVVGLGNPGSEYEGTRHNVGFAVIERLATRHAFPAAKSQHRAQVARGNLAGTDTLLIRPMTYMNLSGDAVGSLLRYYRGESSNVIVVHDELDFEPGQVRVKLGGGHGGHKGLASVAGHIGRDFARIRIGIGKAPASGVDHVLSRAGGTEGEMIREAILRAADAVDTIVRDGMQKAMNRFNRRPAPAGEEPLVGAAPAGASNDSGE